MAKKLLEDAAIHCYEINDFAVCWSRAVVCSCLQLARCLTQWHIVVRMGLVHAIMKGPGARFCVKTAIVNVIVSGIKCQSKKPNKISNYSLNGFF